MDWQLLEVSIVTILALWVALFAGNSFSRIAAAVMMVLNVLWVLFEKEAKKTAREEASSARPEGAGTRPSPSRPEDERQKEARRAHRIL